MDLREGSMSITGSPLLESCHCDVKRKCWGGMVRWMCDISLVCLLTWDAWCTDIWSNVILLGLFMKEINTWLLLPMLTSASNPLRTWTEAKAEQERIVLSAFKPGHLPPLPLNMAETQTTNSVIFQALRLKTGRKLSITVYTILINTSFFICVFVHLCICAY